MKDEAQVLVRPQDIEVPQEALAILTHENAARYKICPIALGRQANGERALVVAATDPNNLPLTDELQRLTGCRVKLAPATEHNILLGIAVHYGSTVPESSTNDLLGHLDTGPSRTPQKAEALRRMVERPGVAATVDDILMSAINRRSTDVHIEPYEENVYVRFRIDGILYDHMTYDPSLHPQIISRIKIVANLDISQNRLPQDGRFEVKAGDQAYDVRVSTVPISSGEKSVMRILPKGHMSMGFGDLGLNERNREVLEKLIRKPFGMVLATGPTGSGKTTTLYTCLTSIDRVGKNIVTVEDPVEYQLPRIGQIQVHPKIGLTFAAGLRSILRQDPDIIMVGEIRDLETLDMAIHASLTGHLVLSTLHCNDAAGAAARMIDMGAEPFLVSSSVTGIIAQRLVRRLCSKCKEECPVSDAAREQLGLKDDQSTFYHGRGCHHCQGTGYYGRVSVFEVVPMIDPIQQAVVRKAPASEIREIIRNRNIPSLLDDGMDKARNGITTLEEVMRAVYVDNL